MTRCGSDELKVRTETIPIDLLQTTARPHSVNAFIAAYAECQESVESGFMHREDWLRRSILNVARIGPFSSDRAVEEYRRDIWHLESTPMRKGAGPGFLSDLEIEVRKGPVDISF